MGCVREFSLARTLLYATTVSAVERELRSSHIYVSSATEGIGRGVVFRSTKGICIRKSGFRRGCWFLAYDALLEEGEVFGSEEKDELVVEFGANHGFFGVYAPVIAARLPGKSSKQIREKGRTMKRMGRLPHGAFEEETVREKEFIDAPPSSPSEASEGPARSSGDESEASAERDAAVLEFNEWERNPREEWLRSEQRNPLGEELKRESGKSLVNQAPRGSMALC